MNLTRLEIALQIEDVSRRLEEVMDEQRKIISDLLTAVQEYISEVDNE